MQTENEGRPSNPYANDNELPTFYPLTVLKRLCYLSVSCVCLNHFHAYSVVVRSPHVNHEWFKVGLASVIALLGVKAYVEIFEGKLKRVPVRYKNFPKSTHAAIVLFLVSTLAFHIALWPHYRWNSILVLGISFFGVIFQLLLLLPSWLQNVVSFVLLTFFLQEYK